MTTSVENQSKARRIGFFAALGIAIVLFLAVIGPFLRYAVAGWFPSLTPDLQDHRVHEIVIVSTLLVAFGGLVLQLWRRDRHASAVAATFVVFTTIFVVRAASADFFPPPIIFIVLTAVVATLHPARDAVLARAGANVSWPLLVLGLVAVAAMASYALDQSAIQRMAAGSGDPHAESGHWSSMGAIAILPGILAALAAFQRTRFPYAAGGAAFIALVLAAASLAFPLQPSALPASLAMGALAWAAATVAAAWHAVQNVAATRPSAHGDAVA